MGNTKDQWAQGLEWRAGEWAVVTFCVCSKQISLFAFHMPGKSFYNDWWIIPDDCHLAGEIISYQDAMQNIHLIGWEKNPSLILFLKMWLLMIWKSWTNF